MPVRVRNKGKVSIVDVTGKLTAGQEAPLRDAVKELVTADRRLFILNMLEVPFMDSAGLGETAACKMRITSRGGTVKLLLPDRGKVLEILEVTGLDQAFELFHDEGEALASFIE
jgi:anti-sigma B factor antagonist